MSDSYKILTAQFRFAHDVWEWFKATCSKKDSRAVNSYYALLRDSKYNRNKTPEDLAAQHILIHNLMLDAGEVISEGSKCQAYLAAYENDSLLANEVKDLTRDETLTFEKAVLRMEGTIKNFILKGSLPLPGSQDKSISTADQRTVHLTSASSDTRGEDKPPCTFCQGIGKYFAAKTHATNKCRSNPDLPSYVKCPTCNNAGHYRTCERRGNKRKLEDKGATQPAATPATNADDFKVIANFLRNATSMAQDDRKQ
jgi:hypothetical protein